MPTIKYQNTEQYTNMYRILVIDTEYETKIYHRTADYQLLFSISFFL